MPETCEACGRRVGGVGGCHAHYDGEPASATEECLLSARARLRAENAALRAVLEGLPAEVDRRADEAAREELSGGFALRLFRAHLAERLAEVSR